jgi:hypothetical protein
MTPMQLSFLSESRRLSNRRLKQELRVTLRYPTIGSAFDCIGSGALRCPAAA